MIHRCMLFTVLCIVGVFNVAAKENQQLAHQHLGRIAVTTVDENGAVIRADSVQWWVKGKRDKKYDFQCADKLCHRWVSEHLFFEEKIMIHAAASVVRKEDKHCWDLYAGERLLNNKTQSSKMKDISIVLYFTGTACS